MSKPFSQACENNKAHILPVLSHYFNDMMTVLEIGSYTTQHIQFFAESRPQITWQPTDTPGNLPFVHAGLESMNSPNILSPLALDVCQTSWPVSSVGGIFSANTLHIMPEAYLEDFFRGAGEVLKSEGYLCVYGPFKYGGEFTSDSNASFEQWLKSRDPASGVRDIEQVLALAKQFGMTPVADHAMPANNQLLVWQKAG